MGVGIGMGGGVGNEDLVNLDSGFGLRFGCRFGFDLVNLGSGFGFRFEFGLGFDLDSIWSK